MIGNQNFFDFAEWQHGNITSFYLVVSTTLVSPVRQSSFLALALLTLLSSQVSERLVGFRRPGI